MGRGIIGETYKTTHFQDPVSARHRSIQYKFLHRIDYTPAKPASINQSPMAECWRCSFSLTDFLKFFWFYHLVQRYWRDVAQFITSVTTLSVPLTNQLCFLGLIEGLANTLVHRILLSILLFYAWTVFILHWKNPEAPTLIAWKGLVNKVIPFYKATYLSWGCPRKFEKEWGSWISATDTNG